MIDSIRDSFVGQIIHHASSRRLLQYPEQHPSFVVPAQYLPHSHSRSNQGPSRPSLRLKTSHEVPLSTSHTRETSDATVRSHVGGGVRSGASSMTLLDRPDTQAGTQAQGRGGMEKASHGAMGQIGGEGGGEAGGETVLVDWYGPDDPENPLNWPLWKKSWLTFCITLLTFSVYIGSSIWSPALYVGADFFGVSLTASTLGIALFVLGYGLGPLFLAPITEIPAVGRTAPYIITLAIYCVLQVPNALVDNFAGFCVLRFLCGVVGSPVLATGGASVADIFYPEKVAYAMSLYGFAAAAGPGVGPIAVAWAIDAKGWQWAFWEMLWLSGFAVLFLAVFMPETNPETILHRRASRLRRLTGNKNLRSEGEIRQSHQTPREVLSEALLRPLSMTVTEPIIIGVNLYIGLMYATIYTFFESFPMVFHYGYGWTLGLSTLPFAGIMLGEAISFGTYCWWNWAKFEGRYIAAKGRLAPETRLPLTVLGSVIMPIAIFWFAWSANRTHWINPVLAATLFGVGIDFIFMPYFNYLPSAYPRFAASSLASNDFVRSMMAAAMPIVAIPLFHNLGVDWGNTIIGACSVLFIPLPIVLIRYGSWLRERSPLCVHDDEIQLGTEWEKYHGPGSSDPVAPSSAPTPADTRCPSPSPSLSASHAGGALSTTPSSPFSPLSLSLAPGNKGDVEKAVEGGMDSPVSPSGASAPGTPIELTLAGSQRGPVPDDECDAGGQSCNREGHA